MATKDTNYLVAVHKGLDESLEKQVAALPEKFNKQRFLQNCMTVLQDGQADFSKCEAPTVVRTLLKGAFLGLDFFNGECYAIPYGNQCQFQTDYKGEIKLCKRYSSNPIQDIYAKVVREGDQFEEVIENGKQYVNFRPKTFSNGEIIGAFAVVLYKDGSMMYDTMSKEDIEHTRQTFSKAANSNAATQKSVSFKIDTVPPELSVTSPVNKLVTNKTTVTVAGTTNDATSSPVTLTINGSAVTVYDDGTFSKDITLKDGSNTITVVAKDGAGRTTTVTRTVTLDTKAPVISDVSLAPNPADVGATYVISVSVTD